MSAAPGRPVALALRALGLGDFVTGLPALGLLKAALPDHEVVLAAPAAFAPLVPLIPALDRLLPAAELAPIVPVPDRLDVAVDLHGNGPASRRLLSALRPRRLFGFADPAGTLPGPAWHAGEHEVSRWCRLVREVLPVPDGKATGTPQAVHCMRLPPTGMPEARTVVHPGAAAGSRRWPADRFAAVAAALRRQGHPVVVTGGPAERELARTVANAAGVPVLTNLTLLELVSLVGRARLVVCGDTGVAHVASNYGIPSVVLFGPVSPVIWGPPAGGPHRVLWHGDGTGDPHGWQADPALLAITVAEVLAAAGELVPGEPALSG
ncbi:glycosyltransferase family 9 protein [Jatrophihabitans sp.]|uniref:glycosyltransferase family 9 protein n=1 Tax=Jatrophihabitans sp. TaxID=1932789 RepID=UPI002BAD4DAA|nr:glycosyltransferase family 9 protein [Jatrophihabitans sp.]